MDKDALHAPTLTPKLLTEDKEILQRAAEKWLKFHHGVWDHINRELESNIRMYTGIAIWLRLSIIVLSASVTTISDIDTVPRTIVTVVAGLLTAFTGIEAFLKYGERGTEMKRQQREIEALRDQLRYQWFVEVETEPDMVKRTSAAKKLLEEGPRAYNDILSKYALKAEKGEAPKANV